MERRPGDTHPFRSLRLSVKGKGISASLVPYQASLQIGPASFAAALGDVGLKPTPVQSLTLLTRLLPGSLCLLTVSMATLPDSLYPRASSRNMTPRVTVVLFMAPDGKTIDVVAPRTPRSFSWM